MKLFSQLVQALNEFESDEPLYLESDLERKIVEHLRKYKFSVTSQLAESNDRYDIICENEGERVCIELKRRAEIQDIKQFDRYLPKFRDGFIVLCWQCSFSVRDIFRAVKDQSPIPVALIELSEKYALV